MNFQCPKCQSRKLMPVASSNGVRPNVPRSLVILIPSILVLAVLVLISIVMFVMGKPAGVFLQSLTVAIFLVCAVSGAMFWRVMPNFKIEMQNFMQQQKQWKCRDCGHEWQV
ncbi:MULTISPECIES: hypothetical protein [unclassified Acinetobacter]|uniref:hypothetical protein n=1 Tax=unclassified Acinetobacter TaxID=196816 RepID=UPI0035B884AD